MYSYTLLAHFLFSVAPAPIVATNMDTRIKRELVKVRKAVKRKLQALKEGIAGQELFLSRTYQPITKSIRDLKTELSNEIKTEIKKEKDMPWSKGEVAITSTPKRTSSSTSPPPLPPQQVRKADVFTNTDVAAGFPSFIRTENIGEIDTTAAAAAATSEGTTQRSEEATDEAYEQAKHDYLEYVNGPMFNEFLEEFDPLPRYYVEGIIKNTTGEYNNEERELRRDKIRYEWETNKFFIGDSEITFEGPNLCVVGGALCYKGSIGLYELLFKLQSNYPFSIKERKDYADILKRTSAVYSLRPQLSKTGGRGLLLDLNEKPVEYIYFDDVNELCERLKLLIASQGAGNTSHSNEIASILEELRECGIIE